MGRLFAGAAPGPAPVERGRPVGKRLLRAGQKARNAALVCDLLEHGEVCMCCFFRGRFEQGVTKLRR